MARYTCSFTLAATNNTNLRQAIAELLQECNLELVYERGEYIMARESIGRISLAKLVAVEVLIDTTYFPQTKMRMTLVAKNEELPLQIDNHCYQTFERINRAIANNQKWQLVESLVS